MSICLRPLGQVQLNDSNQRSKSNRQRSMTSTSLNKQYSVVYLIYHKSTTSNHNPIPMIIRTKMEQVHFTQSPPLFTLYDEKYKVRIPCNDQPIFNFFKQFSTSYIAARLLRLEQRIREKFIDAPVQYHQYIFNVQPRMGLGEGVKRRC